MAFVHTRARVIAGPLFASWCSWRARRLRFRSEASAGRGRGARQVPVGTRHRGAGQEAWLVSREYFRQLIDSYPAEYLPGRREAGGWRQLPRRRLARARCGDRRVKEFLCYSRRTRAPTTRSSSSGWRTTTTCAPTRDQTETRETIAESTAFVQRFPKSPLFPEASARLREAATGSDHEYGVGIHYLRTRTSVVGAIDRFATILKNDPQYTRRDAVYYQMAQAWCWQQPAAAIRTRQAAARESRPAKTSKMCVMEPADLKAQMAGANKEIGFAS